MNAVLVLIAVSLVLSSAITPIFTRRLEGEHADPGRLGRRVLLVLLPDVPVRHGVAALAVRLARSDDGIVVPVVVMADMHSSGEDAWKTFESSLVLLGIDREVAICVDDDIVDGVRHAAESHHCTSVVIDDLDGAIHDQFGSEPLARPVLFVGHLTDRAMTLAAVDGGHDGQPALVDLAGRLARDMGPISDDCEADLILEPAGSIEPDGDKSAAYVRVLSPADV